MPQFNNTDFPIGTPEEIAAMGGDLAEWGSCSPRDIGKNMGCPHWKNCIFHFRGEGPRNIGYFIQIDSGASDERVGSCFFYMQTLHAKASNPSSAEVIGVVAHEGEEIETYETVPMTPGSNTDLRMKREEKLIKVPAFPRPGEQNSAMGPREVYDQRKVDLIKQRMRDAATGRKLEKLEKQTTVPAVKSVKEAAK